MDSQDLQSTPPTHRNRTIAVDIAKLIKANKLSDADIKALDKDVRAEAMSYASMLEDEPTTPLTIRKHSIQEPTQNNSESNKKIRQTPLQQTQPEVAPIQPKPLRKPEPVKPEEDKVIIKPLIRKTPPAPVKPPEPIPVLTQVQQPKPTPPPAPLPTPSPITSSGEDALRLSLNDIATKKEIIARDIRGFVSEKNDLLHVIDSLKNNEKEIESEETRIRREIVETVAIADKRTLEETRWGLEDKRQSLEKERWENRKKIENLDEKINQKRKEEVELNNKQKEVEENLKNYTLKEDAKKASTTLIEQESAREKIIEKKKKYELDWSSLNTAILSLEHAIEEKKLHLKEATKTLEEIEKKERGIDNENERHRLEEQRWAADKNLRDIEKEIWNADEEISKKLQEKKDLESTFASIQIEEEDTLEKISKLKALIYKAEHLK